MRLDELIPILLFQVALVLVLSRAMGILFNRFRQPQVVGEMVAGIMLGPSLFGWLSRLAHAHGWTSHDWSAVVFPAASLQALGVMSQVGVIFFLFLVGLELDPKLIRNRGKAAVVISHVSIVAPFLLGAALTLLLYSRLFNDTPQMRFTAVALFMGAAMSITAFPVLARILTERNLHKTRVGAVAITCAAVDDVTAWCMLAFVVAIARAIGSEGTTAKAIAGAATTAALSAAYVLVMFFVVRPLLRRIQNVYDRQGRLSQNVVAVILLLTLASAWTTEKIGIHALFGAFLMGAIMPKGTGFVRTLAEKLEDYTVVFLLPIFFAYTGLKTEIGLLNNLDLWLATGVIILVACLGKFGGSTLAARACGVGWRESATLGILMNTRGLMELVILNVGREMGVITPAVFAMMVLMALVTTALTTPVLHVVYPRKLFDAEYSEFAGAAAGGSGSKWRRGAFTVLIPVADPRSGGPLLRLAELLVGRAAPSSGPAAPAVVAGQGAGSDSGEPTATAIRPPAEEGAVQPSRRIYALHLRRPVDREAYRTGLERERPEPPSSEASLQPLLEQAERRGVAVETVSFMSRDVPTDIANVARERAVDLILMGFHRSVLGRTMLGGTVHKVLTGGPADVGVFVDHGFKGLGPSADGGASSDGPSVPRPGRVLVPYLGSTHDRLALELAGRLGRNAGAEVTVLHVVPPGRGEPGGAGTPALNAGAEVDRVFADPSSPASVRMRVVEDASPAEAVVRESEGYDLVIVGLSEQWGLESHLFGFRTERIAQGVATSLLMVRKEDRRRATPLAGETAQATDGEALVPRLARPEPSTI